MKKYLAILCWFLLGMAILLPSCANSLERDAKNLAAIQKQRVEMIHHLLKTHDSTGLDQCRNQLLILDAEYDQLQADYTRKYSDSASRARFDKAFKKALSTNH